MKNEVTQSTVRSILRNEITWLFFIVSAIFGSVTTVILPLQKLQLQTEQIQVDIAQINVNNQKVLVAHQDFDRRLTILETKLK